MSKASYKKLKARWYAKLAAEGFNDIETAAGDLKQGSNRIAVREKSPIVLQAKAEYYQMAYGFLNSYRFDSHIDRIIWEYHSNGLSARSISKILTAAKVIKTKNHTSIWQIVKRLRNIMMVRR